MRLDPELTTTKIEGWSDAIRADTDAISGIDCPIESAPNTSTTPSAAPASTDGSWARADIGTAREPTDPPTRLRQSGMVAQVFLPGPKSDMEFAAGPETRR